MPVIKFVNCVLDVVVCQHRELQQHILQQAIAAIGRVTAVSTLLRCNQMQVGEGFSMVAYL